MPVPADTFRPVLDPDPVQDFPLHYGGRWQQGRDEARRAVRRPSTGVEGWSVAEATPDDVDAACAAAATAFPDWAALDTDERRPPFAGAGGHRARQDAGTGDA